MIFKFEKKGDQHKCQPPSAYQDIDPYLRGQ